MSGPDSALPLRPLRLVLLLALLLVTFGSCDMPYSPPLGNTLPDTRLANVPENDTTGRNINVGVVPEQTLFWTGDDPDGYVVGYRYRWIDFHRASPETTAWTTLINLTNIAGSPLDTFIMVYPRAPSIYRIYNFLATIRSTDSRMIDSIQRNLANGRYFAVPYVAGAIEGDSIRGADPVQVEAPNKGTFIFNSPADSNKHRFEVKAIDNSDAEDPTPAVTYFWTRPSPGLIVSIPGGPPLNQAPFLIRCPTERNQGLTFTFAALDASTSDREYSWTVDDSTQGWSPWSRSPNAVVTAANLLPQPSDTHTIYARGRNRWGVISPAAFRLFRARIPPLDDPGWPRRILILNSTRYLNYPLLPTGAIDTLLIGQYYTSILDSLGLSGRYDVYHRQPNQFIDRMKLAEYSTLIYLSEAKITIPFGGPGWQLQTPLIPILREYLSIGGNLIWVGSPGIKSIFGGGGYTTFAVDIFHLNQEGGVTPFREDPEPNFVGATGRGGYPNVTLDPAKVPPDSLGLRDLSTHYPRGFAVPIYEWVHRTGDFRYQGVPIGVRYFAPDAEPGPYCRRMYSVVFFGFPLYYVNKSQAAQALGQALRDLNEL